MKCKFCGSELVEGTSFCIKCGKNNAKETVDLKEEKSGEGGENVNKIVKNKISLNMKVILTAILIVVLAAIFFLVTLIIPCKPKATLASGRYDECKNLSFEASKLLPFLGETKIYVSENDGEFHLYDGEKIILNQVKKYSYDVYTISSTGIKSSKCHYEYDMNVPVPHELKVTLNPGTYNEYKETEIKVDDGSKIYYTIDGTDPTTASKAYSSAIHLEDGKTVIKAIAVNNDGTISKIYEWEYEVKLPVPANVSYSIESGLYYKAFELELKSDDDSKIYYTLDGSEPSSKSNVYSEPIKLEEGVHTVKAIAINGYNLSSKVTTGKYTITLQKYGRYAKSAITDKWYGSVGKNGELVSYDLQMKENKRYSIKDVTTIYASGDDIYYLGSDTLYKLNSNNGTGTKLTDMKVENFVIINKIIYVQASRVLYALDLTGKTLKKYSNAKSSTIMGCWNNELYFNGDNKIYKLTSVESEPELVSDIDTEIYFVKDNKMYYIDSEGGLSLKDLESGEDNIIIEYTSETSSLDPEFEMFNVSDEYETVTEKCICMYACNNTLYILKQIDNENRVYHILSGSTDKKVNTTYQWFSVDLDTNNVSEMEIYTPDIAIFDDVIIDGYENRIQVVQ